MCHKLLVGNKKLTERARVVFLYRCYAFCFNVNDTGDKQFTSLFQ